MQQVEIDTEKHILTQTKKLSDGSYEKIFSRNPRGVSGYFTYNCHLCGVPNLPGEKALQTHITGKKHQNRLLYNYTPDATVFRSYIGSGKSPQTIFPGEPIPPGFEDEMNPICIMDEIIAKIEKPLIGLEYILELHDMKAKEPLYVCTLCDKRCDPRNIIPQITSHRHRMKYLDFHFPKIMNILNRQSRFNTDMSYREEVLTKVAGFIEEKSKRQKPTVEDYKKYEMSKTEITEKIKKMKHFDESDLPDAEKILSSNSKSNDLLDDVSSSSDSEFEEYIDKSQSDIKRSSMKFEDVRVGKFKEKGMNNNPMFSNTTELPSKSEIKKILTPRELSEQSNAKMQEKYTIEKYKASVSIAIEALEKKFKEHNKNPEKHPLYSEEWKSFWSRRYKELLSQGKDANSHDYKQEWIEFWMNRMKELHEEDIKSKKNEIRRKLNLTKEFIAKIENEQIQSRSKSKSPVYSRSKSPSVRSRSPISRSRSNRHSRSPVRRIRRSRSPIEISDDSDGENYRKSNRFERKRFRYDDDRSHSRISDSPNSYRSASNFRDIRRSPSPEIYCKDGEINLVSVCRLLSALESDIGILADRVIALLTKAIAMEKMEANSCDNLLFDDDNMILMETVKERLKGGLSANLVASHKIPPVKRAIQQIASLIYETNKKKQAKPVQVPKKQPEPAKKEDVNEAARLEIARVLTESLIEQGRDDITPEELEEMIEAFIQEGLETVKEEEEPVQVQKPQQPQPKQQQKSESRPTTPTLSPGPSKAPKEDNFTELENLTDDDLKTLLRNFSDLTCDEQNHLITYLSKIENTDRLRVERLRKYVDIGDEDIESECEREDVDNDPPVDTTKSSFRMSPEKAQILSDDEYEDTEIVKSMNATVNNEPKSLPINPTLSNTGAVANELMSSLMTSFMQTSSWDMPVQQPPMQETWDMPIDNKMQYSMPNMMMQQPYYNQSMPIHNTVSPWQQPLNCPPPTMQDMSGMSYGQYPPRNGPRIDPRQNELDLLKKRKLERPNNTQLTGKGKNRR